MSSNLYAQCTLSKESCTLTFSTETFTSTITGSEWDTEKVCLQANLVVDDDFTIDGSEVYIGADLSIVVQSSNTLTITNSELFADDEMWENIYVEAGATLNISGSIVAHALIGIFAENTTSESFLNVYNNHFCNNEIGIYIGPFSSSSGLTSLILNNEFSAPSLIEPLSGEIGDYGIFVDNVTTSASGPALLIGNSTPFTVSSTFNHFHNMNIGVRVLESKVTMQNNLFENFTSGSAAELPNVFPINENHNFRNTAIVASSEASNLQALVVGTSVISGYNNEIRNSSVGIQVNTFVKPTIIANNIRGNISGSTYSMHTGISIENYSNTVVISDNRIERFHTFGIRQVDQVQTTSTIADNIISTFDGFTSSLSPVAISISEPTGGTSLVQTIENNTISEVRTGIRVTNATPVQVLGNIVDYESTSASSTSYGIRLQNCPEALVQSNEVTGDCTSGSCGGEVRNIVLEGCEEALVDQNYTQYGTAGLWFQGSSIYTNFTCNEIRDCFKGVMWYNLGPGLSPPVIGTIESSSGGPSDNAWFPATTQNRLHVHAITDASNVKWRYRNDFDYYDLEYDPSLITQSATGADLPNPEIVSGETCDMPLRTSDDEVDALTALENKYDVWLNSYLSNDEYNAVSYYYAWRFWQEIKFDEELVEQFTESLESVYAKLLTTNIPDLQNVNALMAENNYAEALELNSTITPDNAIEENLQAVNAIYCSNIDASGNVLISDENIAILENIAQLDGLVNGNAVYLAQGMLKKWYDVPIDFAEERKHEENPVANLLIYPNPATEYLYIEDPELVLNLYIFDFTGRTVYQTNQITTGIIYVKNFKPGIYLIQINNTDGSSKSGLVSIITIK